MKKYYEMAAKMHNHYVNENYIQIMLGYQDYLLFFGNNNLMYNSNIDLATNAYLNDKRKKYFPYSQIPEHIEKVSLFKKMIFVNQIIDFEKPYIRINDGLITKVTAFKDGSDAIVHTKVLNGKISNKKTKTISREELETYLKTGSLVQLDESEYENTCIFDMKGILCDPRLELEQKWIDEEKERLSRIIDENDCYKERTKKELQRAISTLDDISSFTLEQKLMIKFKQNGEVKIDAFVAKYLERGKYEIVLKDLPVTMESLSMIKSKAELPVIKTMKEPNIRLSLNPNVTKEQLKREKEKILAIKK